MSGQLFLRSKGLSLPQPYYFQRYRYYLSSLVIDGSFTFSHLVLISQSFLLLSSLCSSVVSCSMYTQCPLWKSYKSVISYRILLKRHIVLCEFSTGHIRVCIDSSHNGNILLKKIVNFFVENLFAHLPCCRSNMSCLNYSDQSNTRLFKDCEYF